MARQTPDTLARQFHTTDLCRCVEDVLSLHKDGTLKCGSLRILAEHIQILIPCDDDVALQLAEAAVLREASIRYVGISAPQLSLVGRLHLFDVEEH